MGLTEHILSLAKYLFAASLERTLLMRRDDRKGKDSDVA
jgi:hypothetical protein